MYRSPIRRDSHIGGSSNSKTSSTLRELADLVDELRVSLGGSSTTSPSSSSSVAPQDHDATSINRAYLFFYDIIKKLLNSYSKDKKKVYHLSQNN